MTFWTLMICLLVFGTLGLGVTRALQWLRQRAARINLCLFHLETARELAHQGNRKYAAEVRRHLNLFRTYCQRYNFEATELSTDANEMAELLNRVMQPSAQLRSTDPRSMAVPPIPSVNPKVGETPPPIPREAHELQLTGLHDLDFDEDK